MDNKINNADTEEMKEEKAMQEVSTENLENVAGGNSYTDKIKEDVQGLVMTQKEKDEIDSLLFKLRVTLVTAYGAPMSRYLRWPGKKEPEKKSETEIIRDKLKAYAKKYPYYPKLKQFLK